MFDIKQLLASPGLNRLLQPLMMGGGQGMQPPNMLAGAGQMPPEMAGNAAMPFDQNRPGFPAMPGFGGMSMDARKAVGVLPSTGRPMLANADGSVSTEESITVTDPRLNGGRPTNIPSIWGGKRRSEDEAVTEAIRSGQRFQPFNSIDEAVAAARVRSNSLGQEVDSLRGGAQRQKPGFMDRYNAFTESDRGRTLNDFFLGLAMGSNPNQSLAGAAQMVATGRSERAGKKNQNQTVEWLMKQGMSPEEAQMIAGQPNVLSEYLKTRMKGGQQSEYEQRAAAAQQYGLDPNSPEGQAFILSGDLPEARGGAAELGLNPQYGVDDQGNPVLIQIGKDGKAVQTAMPEGVKLSKEPIKLDAGTHWVLLDPISRQPIGQVPKELAAAEAQKEIGTAQGKAAAAAPGDIQAGRNALDLVESLRSDPSRQRGTGMSSVFNAIPGTAGYDYASKVSQAKSGAFLSAIQQLRGMGALSNAEGETATKAITRLDTAMSEEAFLAALNDYETILRQGLAKAERMAERFGIETPPMAIPNNGPVDYRDYFGGK